MRASCDFGDINDAVPIAVDVDSTRVDTHTPTAIVTIQCKVGINQFTTFILGRVSVEVEDLVVNIVKDQWTDLI